MTRRLVRRWLLLSAAALLMAAAFSGLLAPNILRSYLVRWSDMQQAAPRVYVDSGMSPDQRDRFLMVLDEAEARVVGLYGDYTAEPTIIAGHTMHVMEAFGGNSYNRAGRTLSSGISTFIILGPQGIRDVDILAHELAHAEFFKRIGYRKRDQVTNWFDEGLAVQVDDRVSLEQWRLRTDNGSTAPELSQMGVIRHDDWLGYATAKHEVRRWLDVVGQRGLLALIESVRAGEDFHQVYGAIEEAAVGMSD